MEKVKSKIRLNRTQILLMYFFIFAFLGWVMETLYCIHTLGYFTKRGFLYGPICPIYGYGALMLILFLYKYRKNNFKLFFYSAIIFSTFEYIVSYVLEALFGMYWWNYTNEPLNLNGRTGAFYFFIWGVIAIIFMNHIYPFLKKKINLILAKIPYKVQISVLYSFFSVYIVDTISSFVRYLA